MYVKPPAVNFIAFFVLSTVFRCHTEDEASHIDVFEIHYVLMIDIMFMTSWQNDMGVHFKEKKWNQ